MTDTRPTASIVIPVWNGAELTEACLPLVLRALRPGDEVVVVDNGSTDRTPSVLAAHPQVRVVRHEENLGFAGGCNSGAEVAAADVVVFLNNDTLPVGTWLEDLLAPFADPSVGATGPMSNCVSGPQLLDDPAYRPRSLDDVREHAAALRAQQGAAVEHTHRLVGFCLAVRRDVLGELGGFDTRFGIGSYEDDDLCRRIRGLGLLLAIARGAFVHHIGHATFTGNGLDWLALETENRVVLASKTVSLPDVSVVVRCSGDVRADVATVIDVLDHLARHTGLDFEVLLLTDDPAPFAPVVEELGGIARVVEVDPTGDGALRQGLLAASGVRRALLSGGEVTDAALLEALLAQAPDDTAPVGVGREAAAVDPEGPAAPRVTIVIPVHDRCDLTLQCLESIAATQGALSTPFELVVVDNASTDATPQLLAELGGDVRTIRNETNLGFGDACNQGAALARGEYVLFLNNDTQVLGDWLDVLVAAMDEDERRGAAQPKLLYPDGRLNDAGGLVFRDGEAWVYGKGSPHPDAPAYDVRRAPDYASGACLIVRRTAFEEVGGFDHRYAPAYYEDTDLSFALRRAGFTLLYEPAAVVVHLEGGTAGQDETTGFKAHQPANKLTFAAKWADELADRPVLVPAIVDSWAHRPRGGEGPGEAIGAVDGLRFLVIDPFPPMYDRAGGCARTLELEKTLRSLGHSVVHEASALAPERQRYARHLSRWGIRLHGRDPRLPAVVDARGVSVHAPEHPRDGFDVIIVGPWETAELLLPGLRRRFPSATVLVDTCDLHFVREERSGTHSEGVRALRKARELATYSAADGVIAVSAHEAGLLAAHLPAAPVSVVGLRHDVLEVVPPLAGRHGVCFVGNTNHPPNTSGARWLVEEVWPRVLELAPDAELRLVGNDPSGFYATLARDSVEAVGWVPDTAEVLDGSRVSVAPLVVGAGVKVKVAEALSRGLPVVTTPVGAEGLHLRGGSDAVITDDPEQFARAIARLLTDDAEWRAMSSKALDHARAHTSGEGMRDAVIQLVEGVRRRSTRAEANLITLVVNTKDEASNIEACIGSCRGVDRIVVVDMESTDGTREIAASLGAEVHRVPDVGLVEPARQYALSTVGSGWILLLDADERMAPGGVESLREMLPHLDPDVAALMLTGFVYLGDRRIDATGWDARYEQHIRVMRSGRVTWPSRIHGVPEVDGGVISIPPSTGIHLDHHNWRDFGHFLEKTVRYTAFEAEGRVGEPHTEVHDDVAAAVEEFKRRYSPEVDGEASFALSFGMLCYKMFTSLRIAEAGGFARRAPDAALVARALDELVRRLRDGAAPGDGAGTGAAEVAFVPPAPRSAQSASVA